jgi:type II secretory pathway component PulF
MAYYAITHAPDGKVQTTEVQANTKRAARMKVRRAYRGTMITNVSRASRHEDTETAPRQTRL